MLYYKEKNGGIKMAYQIYCGKGFDTQKAERFFKERRAQVQAVGPGKELGAAALLLCDLDLHKNLPFCFFLDCTGGAVFYPVRTFFQNISVLRHFAGRRFS